MAGKTVAEALREALREEMARDERVIVLGEDVGKRGGVFNITLGLHQDFGDSRVFDTPLAESGIVGAAIGLSVVAFRPVAEIQFAAFVYPAMDQIINEAARMRYRSAGDFGCPIVIRIPYGGGTGGALYHSQSVEAFFCHVPGLKVVAPATPYDAKGLLKAAIRDEDPVIFLEHKKTYFMPSLINSEVPAGDYTVPIGKADVKRAGGDLTVLTYGMMLHESLQAAQVASQEGIEVEIVDLRTLFPPDRETILTSVKKTGKVLIVHEDTKTGGLGGELAAIIAEDAFEYLDGPIMRVTGLDVPAMPYNQGMESFFMPDAGKIAGAIRELVAY
ncbi:MAG: alpha-ketoacid dehydrogenase subunit beta [Anaerolineae bacterium]